MITGKIPGTNVQIISTKVLFLKLSFIIFLFLKLPESWYVERVNNIKVNIKNNMNIRIEDISLCNSAIALITFVEGF